MKSDDSGSRVLHEESASEIGDRVSESDGEGASRRNSGGHCVNES